MRPSSRREGCQIFADELARFADRDGTARLAEISARVAEPLSVEVRGRRGVGVSAVTTALRGAGLRIAEDGDVAVLVIAEVFKPEDAALLAQLSRSGRPAIVVLNKADLSGSGPGGPLASAHRMARHVSGLAGVPVVPMVALLAFPSLSAELLEALEALVGAPADLTSADAFVAGPHPLSPAVRVDLLRRLDRFGIVHALLALSRGADDQALPGLLRQLSGVERVSAAVDSAGASVRYRRVQWALTELRAVGGTAVGRFLAADDTVIAVMAAAVDVLQNEGLTVDPGTGREAHLCRARRWRRYRDGPVNTLHRSCGDAVVRGSLRLLGTAGDGR